MSAPYSGRRASRCEPPAHAVGVFRRQGEVFAVAHPPAVSRPATARPTHHCESTYQKTFKHAKFAATNPHAKVLVPYSHEAMRNCMPVILPKNSGKTFRRGRRDLLAANAVFNGGVSPRFYKSTTMQHYPKPDPFPIGFTNQGIYSAFVRRTHARAHEM